MFKWHSQTARTDAPLVFGHFDFFDGQEESENKDGFSSRLIFEGQTAYLQRLHCHVSTLAPGAGYEPHIDAYDVGIVVLEGEIETLEERVGPHGVILYPAGEPHGIRNAGKAVAKYVVFEFHGSQKALEAALPVADRKAPRHWRGGVKRLLKRFIEAMKPKID
jgi:quercetin dioxygenase-like cupin family protein